jgi:hypothetical protein
MRKLLLIIAILIALAIGTAALWIFKGPKISLLVDKYGITESSSEEVHSIRYEGTGTGGVLHANEVWLSLNEVVPPLKIPSVGSTKDGKLGLAYGGKVFPLGQLPQSGDDAADVMVAAPDNGDDGRVIIGHSKLSWPTPFGVNFMTGYSPSWKRHSYQRLNWTKANGMKLEMVWRYEQYFDSVNRWTSPTMTKEGETGLINIEITPK